MDPRDLYPLVPKPDKTSLPPQPQEGDGWHVLRELLRAQRRVEEAVSSSPSADTQHKGPQNIAAPPLRGRYLETLESDQDGEQHFIPAFLEVQSPASLQPSEQGMTGATTSTSSGGEAAGETMTETHKPLPPHLRRKKTVSESAGDRQEHTSLEKDATHQNEELQPEELQPEGLQTQ
ncbi:hypothetical protein KC343_g134 [Hortaea werneckii]|nr:hypothetical protein KC352_g1244 [Hortaea werneckii]KAI7573133.1 hypothetical protein KC317_g154 [Hortaea werneckii]KAI7628523.1 hypothetical protein KC346_g130 [Hortaea werneckii]KAI7638356.1 hypothetical protein KC343_g134 [Hortaea werneckii]KAI7683992.1 hypothetical protein KC319_g161 [Hortaea werneckii]